MQIYKPYIFEFDSQETLYREAENFVVDKILETNADKGKVRLALSGGKTPIPLYQSLGNNSILPWEEIEIYQTDERYVPPDSPDSNRYNIAQNLGPDIVENNPNINFFDTKLPLDITVQDYIERIESLDETFFDLTILGIGPDGHIASLFPGGAYLKHQDSPVLDTLAPDYFPVQQRISLSIESILNSDDIMILLVGSDKRSVISELLEGEKRATDFPAKFLLAHPRVRVFQFLQD